MASRSDQLQLNLLLLLALLATACSAKPTPGPADASATSDVAQSDTGADADAIVLEGCNPMGYPYDCMLPFPSDVFLVDGAVRLEQAAPTDKFGDPFHVDGIGDADGFSVHPAIQFTFGEGLDPASLVPHAQAALSVTPESPTLLINASTGEPVPHFSEVYAGGSEEDQIGAIRPLIRLDEATRYVVGIQGVRTAAGADVTPPALFAARVEPDVLEVLEAFGVDGAELDLAWDFTTRSRANLIGDMLSIREGTLAWLESNTPTVTITEIAEGADLGVQAASSFRHVEGTFLAPLWTETDEPGARLVGPQGAREIVGTIEVPFTIAIPNSIEADPTMRPARFLQYGHGFFGRRQEVTSEVQVVFGDEFGFVMGAIEWSGMARADREWVVGAFGTEPTTALNFVPRVHQGIANQLVFTEVIKTLLPAEPALQLGGASAYDPDQVYFYGISQGHILGGTFMAMTPSIDRAVLNVGGASLGLILTRSYAFLVFELLLKQSLVGLELRKYEALAPLVFEVIDPISYAPLVRLEPLPESPSKEMLLQGGLNDTTMPNVATELHARALGIGLVTPSPKSAPFLTEVPAPAASGLTFFDFGLDPELAVHWDAVNVDSIAHDSVRLFDGARQQIDRFFRPNGMVEDTCSGPCVVP